MIILAVMRQRLAGQPGEDDVERLDVHRVRLVVLDAEIGNLEGRDALADADLEPAAAHLVEHADLFDQAQRIVKRQGIDQRAEAQSLGALRHRREEYARRRRHAERRRVVLRQVIGVEAGAVIRLDQLQAALIERAERLVAPVEMIENAEVELHGPPPLP